MKTLFLATTALILTFSGNVLAEDAVPQQRDTIRIGSTTPDDQYNNNMASHMNAMFNNLFNQAFGNDPLTGQKNFIPIHAVGITARSDMYETKDNIVITVDMPGIKKEDVDLQISSNAVSIKYEQKKETATTTNKDKDYILNERSYGSFERQFTLPPYADSEHAQAKYEDGVLHITIPKLDDAKYKAKKLEIK